MKPRDTYQANILLHVIRHLSDVINNGILIGQEVDFLAQWDMNIPHRPHKRFVAMRVAPVTEAGDTVSFPPYFSVRCPTPCFRRNGAVLHVIGEQVDINHQECLQ